MNAALVQNQANRMLKFSAALVCLTLAACGGGGGGGSNNNGSTGGGTPAPTGTASLSVGATAVDFGTVIIGRQVSRTVTITNTGTRSLTLTFADPGTGFTLDGDGNCGSMAANASCEMTVLFAPDEQIEYSGSLQIDSDAPTVTVPLSGRAEGLGVEITSVATSCPDPSTTARVLVSDRFGGPVDFLAANHFSLSVNGEPVDLDSFEGIKAFEPVSVAFALDWSDSLSTVRPDIAQATDFFIDFFRDTDTAGIFKFARALDGNAHDFVVTDAAGKQMLQDAVYLNFDGDKQDSLIWDAALTILEETLQEPNSKRAVILVSDGNDRGSVATVDQVIEAAGAENVTFFTVGFGDVEQPERLERLAEETGGLYFYFSDNTELAGIYDNIAASLTNQYELVFTVPDTGADSELNVLVTDDQMREGEDSRTVPACP